MMVSYILNVCLKFTKNAKFIIVISNNGFKSNDGGEFINSIKSFVKLINFKFLEQEDRMKVYQSVSMLITAVPMNR